MEDEDQADPDAAESQPERSARRARRPQGMPWTRALLAIAVIGPALWLGGTRPETVIGFLVVVLALWVRLVTRTSTPLQVPRVAWLGVLLVGLTLLQWAPIAGVREAFAPSIATDVETALAGTGVAARPGLTVSAGDTGLEAARLVGLLALFIAAAQLSWRTSAAMVACVGTAVALVGFAHEAFGLDTVYGRFAPEDIDLTGSPALLTSFVNPNHQSSLLLLGTFAAAGLALDQQVAGLATRDPAKVDRHGDLSLAAIAALGIQLPALVLSLSRGAILSLLVVGPIALWLGLRRDPRRKHRAKRQRHMGPLRYIGLLGSLGILLLVAQHGAWRELGTLADATDPDGKSLAKLRVIEDVPALVAKSPWLGTGRGTFIDLYPGIAEHPGHVLYTHLESAPMTAIVEWGPVVGGIFLVGTLAWWIAAFRRDPDRRDLAARRIVLLGIAAMALQNVADFSLEFVGVASPLVALAGGLSANRRQAWPSRLAGIGLGLSIAAAIALAVTSANDAFTRRERRDRAMQRGEIEPFVLLHVRPLDGRVHTLLARRAAEAGDWDAALARAEVATLRSPGAIDGWLLYAAAEHALGNREAADRAMATALSLLHDTPPDALRDHLLARYPDPRELAVLAPSDPAAWRRLVDSLVAVAPRHADAIAAARTLTHPEDPDPLRVRVAIAMRAGNPALALHHARLWRQLAPDEAAAHRAVALALLSMSPPRRADARDALEDALRDAHFASLAERGLVEEVLLGTLLDLGDDASLARAEEVAGELRNRPADRNTQRARQPLIRKALEGTARDAVGGRVPK
jgi:Flp pilus assembly protein TadD